jgi:hypothetical protein
MRLLPYPLCVGHSVDQASANPRLKGLRSSDAFTLRRCQILLASNQGHPPQYISTQLSCSDQCVREAIHAFHQEGLVCLKAKSHATHTNQSAIDAAGLEGVMNLGARTDRLGVWKLENHIPVM